MTNLTFSNKSNAVRGFKQAFPALAERFGNEFIRAEFIGECGHRVGVELDNVAAAQAETARPLTDATLDSVIGYAPLLRRSASGQRPVAKAHEVYAGLPAGTKRADAIAAAVEQGIAYFTARTQYQRWSKAA